MNHQTEEEHLVLQSSGRKTEEQNDKQLFSTIFAIIYNLIWALMFFFFRYYNQIECQLTDLWTLIASSFLFLIVFYKITVELPMIYKVNNNTIKKVVTIVEYIEVVFNIIILLGLTFAYFQFEDCKTLRKFVLFYLIISYTIIVLYGVVTIISKYTNQHRPSEE